MMGNANPPSCGVPVTVMVEPRRAAKMDARVGVASDAPVVELANKEPLKCRRLSPLPPRIAAQWCQVFASGTVVVLGDGVTVPPLEIVMYWI
jgi:hypothetical protein